MPAVTSPSSSAKFDSAGTNCANSSSMLPELSTTNSTSTASQVPIAAPQPISVVELELSSTLVLVLDVVASLVVELVPSVVVFVALLSLVGGSVVPSDVPAPASHVPSLPQCWP